MQTNEFTEQVQRRHRVPSPEQSLTATREVAETRAKRQGTAESLRVAERQRTQAPCRYGAGF